MANENLWKDAEHQLKELDLDLEDDGGYNQWDAAAENEITEDSHWEVRTHTCFSLQLRTPLFIFHAFASVFFPRLTLRMPFFFCVDFFSFFFPLQPRKQYHMRKNANEGKGDAVFNGLEYKAVSVMMPVPVSGFFFIFFSLLPFRSLCLNKWLIFYFIFFDPSFSCRSLFSFLSFCALGKGWESLLGMV